MHTYHSRALGCVGHVGVGVWFLGAWYLVLRRGVGVLGVVRQFCRVKADRRGSFAGVYGQFLAIFQEYPPQNSEGHRIYPRTFCMSTPIRVNRSRRGWGSRHHYRYCRINFAVSTARRRNCGADLGHWGYRRHPGQGLASKSRSDFSVSRAGRYIQANLPGGHCVAEMLTSRTGRGNFAFNT